MRCDWYSLDGATAVPERLNGVGFPLLSLLQLGLPPFLPPLNHNQFRTTPAVLATAFPAVRGGSEDPAPAGSPGRTPS